MLTMVSGKNVETILH